MYFSVCMRKPGPRICKLRYKEKSKNYLTLLDAKSRKRPAQEPTQDLTAASCDTRSHENQKEIPRMENRVGDPVGRFFSILFN